MSYSTDPASASAQSRKVEREGSVPEAAGKVGNRDHGGSGGPLTFPPRSFIPSKASFENQQTSIFRAAGFDRFAPPNSF